MQKKNDEKVKEDTKMCETWKLWEDKDIEESYR